MGYFMNSISDRKKLVFTLHNTDALLNSKLINYFAYNNIMFSTRFIKGNLQIHSKYLYFNLIKQGLDYYGVHYEIVKRGKNEDITAKTLVTIFLLLLFSFGANFYSSKCVWEVYFKGNQTITDEQLYSFLEDINIHPGMLKSKIQCEMLENEFRKQFEPIAWISGEIKGGYLTFYIKESIQHNQYTSEKANGSLKASCNAEVVSIITRQGTPIVKKGDKVKKGDILIDSKVVKTNENEEEDGYIETDAIGEVIGKTKISYKDKVPLKTKVINYESDENSKISLEFKSSSFKSGSFIINKNNIIVTDRTQIKLYGQIYLPIYINRTRQIGFNYIDDNYTSKQGVEILNSRLEHFLDSLQEKRVQIIAKDVKMICDKKACYAEGFITVCQNIAIR